MLLQVPTAGLDSKPAPTGVSGFRVRVYGLGFRVQGLGLGLRVLGLGFWLIQQDVWT